MTGIYDAALVKLKAAKTVQEAEAICAQHEQACAAEVAQLEAAIASERAFRDRLLKNRALRESLLGKIKPKMLNAAMALASDELNLEVTDDQRVIVRSEFGDQPVDLAIAGWLAAGGSAFASASSANALPGPFEQLLRNSLDRLH